MTARDALGLIGSLGVALLGSLVFEAIGFPSAPLTGAAAAVTIAALCGMSVSMPVWLRTVAFVLLGLNIGSSVTFEMLQTALAWPVTIAVLMLSLMISLRICRAGLTAWLGFSSRDAVLAAAPGHLSYVLAISVSEGGATSRIAVVQSIRVLFLTLCVPVLVSRVFGATGLNLAPDHPMSLAQMIALVAMTIAVGWLFQRFRLPAAYLLAGIFCSAAGHLAGATPGRLPEPAVLLAFLVMGTLIGSRFSGQRLRDLQLDLLAGLWVTGTNVVVTLAAVAVSMGVMGLPPALLIVAFAPGGVEAMAAIALTLGLDPAFVAAHHVMRLLILTVLVPLMLGRLALR